MSHDCDYCDESFSSSSCLKRHQDTSQYCLDIQKAKGIEVSPSKHECECGTVFTLKSNMNRHQRSVRIILISLATVT